MSGDKITLWNNRLGITTLPAPKELPPQMRAALASTLRMQPAASIEISREIVELMMRRPGVWPLVESGQISTRPSEIERKRPPTNLQKVQPSELRPGRGPDDYVYGLKADPVLMRMVDAAKRERAAGLRYVLPGRAVPERDNHPNAIARAATEAAAPGDYSALIAALAAQGVSTNELRRALDAAPPGSTATATLQRAVETSAPPAEQPAVSEDTSLSNEPAASDDTVSSEDTALSNEPVSSEDTDTDTEASAGSGRRRGRGR